MELSSNQHERKNMNLFEADQSHLIKKFPAINNPPQADHPIVNAILDNETIVEKAFIRGAEHQELFMRSKLMAAIAADAHRVLREAMAVGNVRYVTASRPVGEPVDDPLDDPFNDIKLMHPVGGRQVFVCRNQPDAFRAALFITNLGKTQPCVIGIAEDCGGQTTPLPTQVGTIILVFNCCDACLRAAGGMAEEDFRLSVLEAQDKLPPVPPSP
jgi:hypothetical protein